MDLPAHLWMKPAEAAKVLHLHPDTLARKVDSGDLMLSVQRSSGGRRRYLRADVAWAASDSPFAHALLADVAAQIHETVSDVGIDLPMSAINDLYKDRYALLGLIKETGSDTDTAEQITDIVAEELTGRDWPTNGDGEREYREFRQDLEREALLRGWTLTREPVDQSEEWLDAAGPAHERIPSGPCRLKLSRDRHGDEVAHHIAEPFVDEWGNDAMRIREASAREPSPEALKVDYIYCLWRPGREVGIQE